MARRDGWMQSSLSADGKIMPREGSTFGQKLTPQTVAQELRDAGYSGVVIATGRHGTMRSTMAASRSNRSAILPLGAGARSRSTRVCQPDSGDGGHSWMRMNWSRSSSPGSPKVIRTKRRLVTYNELPPNLVERRHFDRRPAIL